MLALSEYEQAGTGSARLRRRLRRRASSGGKHSSKRVAADGCGDVNVGRAREARAGRSSSKAGARGRAVRQGATLGGLLCEPSLAPVLVRGGGGGGLGTLQGGGRRVTGSQPRGRGSGRGSGRSRTAGGCAAGVQYGKAARRTVADDEEQRLGGRPGVARTGSGRAGGLRGAASAGEAAERHWPEGGQC